MTFLGTIPLVVRGCEENAPTSKSLEGNCISYEMCRSMQYSGKHITIKLYQLIANSDVSSSGALHCVEKGCSLGVGHHPVISVLRSLMIWFLETFRKTEWHGTAHCYFCVIQKNPHSIIYSEEEHRKIYGDAIENEISVPGSVNISSSTISIGSW